MLANGPVDQVSIPGFHTKTQILYLIPPLLKTQDYKVRIKGSGAIKEMEQRPLLYFSVVNIEKEAIGSLLTKLANFTLV